MITDREMNTMTLGGAKTGAGPSMRPQDIVLGELDALQSFWPSVREKPELAPREACNVLAAWAHLRRFPPESLPVERVTKFNDFVVMEQDNLVAAFMQMSFLDDWITAARGLDASWDSVVEAEATEQLEILARDLFASLDRYTLADYAASALATRWQHDHARTHRAAEEAEQLFETLVMAFLPAADYANDLDDAYRLDLFDYDYELWLTTNKYWYLVETLEECEHPPEIVLSEQDKEAIRALARELTPKARDR